MRFEDSRDPRAHTESTKKKSSDCDAACIQWESHPRRVEEQSDLYQAHGNDPIMRSVSLREHGMNENESGGC
jgi:hypothetical protein